MNNYIFPFQKIEKGENIVLYGAGNVGRCFYKQLITSGYANIALWVDKKCANMRGEGIPVHDVNEIEKFKNVTHIVIAIDNRKLAEEVSGELQREYGISKEKIVWEEHYRFANEGLFLDQNQQKQFGTTGELEKITPKDMLHYYRLDLAVRYLLAKDIVFGIENRANLSLYSRMILARTGAYEDDPYYFDSRRNGTQEYIASVKKLCGEMQRSGFAKEGYVPVGDNGIFLNGAHRIASALALEEDIWISNFVGKNGNTDFTMEWFEKNGFNTDDKIRILRAYADLYENCGMILLFAPCMEQWSYIEAQLKKKMCIVGRADLDFTDNYIAFENLFREIYADPLWRNVYIDRKVELLKMAKLKIRLILVSDEGFKNRDLYKTIEYAKLELRDRMFFDTDIAPVVMHGSNSREEFVHLKLILLSVNNLNSMNRRLVRNYRNEFVERLDSLKTLLRDKHILPDDVCITGSGAWEVYGLRFSDDVDFSVKRKYRDKFGNEHVVWAEKLEYNRLNCVEISDDITYEDDVLIDDDNYHFIFNEIKFVNLDIIARKKEHDRRDKDIRDVRLYELFCDFSKNFDDKEVLKKQIEREFYKKR